VPAPSTPTGIPSISLTAGDTWTWRIQDPLTDPQGRILYQSDGWALKYELQGVGKLDIPGGTSTVVYQAAGADAGYWLVTISKADSSGVAAGRYRLIGRMVGSGAYAGQEYTVTDDVLLVERDPRTAAAGSFQTHNERTLAIIEAAIEGRLTADIESYQIAGRAVSKIPATELVALRNKYAAAVNQERSGRFGRPVAVRVPSVAD
jgi:hypothetical protein